jgi:D-3-phosphoglycerate dehydrogenase
VAGTVLLTDRPFGTDEIEQQALAEYGYSLVRAPSTDEGTLARLAEQAEAVLVCYAPVTAPVIEAAARGGCRVISRYGVGYDNIDVGAATERGILVTYVPDYCLDEVADHTLALLLAAARGIVRASLGVRGGDWTVPQEGIHRLHGSRLALIGVGRIGRAVAERAIAFGFETVAYDPFVEDWAKVEAERAGTLEEAVVEADAISLHAPLTPDNYHLVDEELLGLMLRTPVLVNTSRGGLVDLDAAVRALDNGRLRALAIDVVEDEPLPPNHPLRRHDRAIVTPHMSFYSAEAQEELQRRAVDEVVRALTGRPPRCPVNGDVLAARAR